MGTQSEWIVSDLQTPKSVKPSHRLPLVSPRMDVDVTGVSLRNVRTQLIDHPRDDGLKHREQLWNFQQKYRGAIGKSRPTPINTDNDERRYESSESDDTNDEDVRPSNNARSRNKNDQPSLPSRFRKRLIKQKLNFTGLRSGEFILDSTRRRSESSRETKEEEKPGHSGIQRLYSSGLIVKNTLYKQLRNEVGEDKRSEHYGDNSRILETIQKYGSLEKLPDIVYPGTKTPQPHLRFLKSLSSYNRRILEQVDKRLIPRRRTLSQISDLGSSKRKLIIVSRRGGPDEDKLVRLGCIDPFNVDMDDDENNNEDANELEEDEDDECDNENQVSHAAKLHIRDCDQKRPEHVDIRCNITQVNTQDDMVLIEKHKQETAENSNPDLRLEFTFHGDPRKTNTRKQYSRTDLRRTDSFNSKSNTNKRVKEIWNSKSSSREKCKDKEDVTERLNSKQTRKKKVEVEDNVADSDSDESLDIPEDRFGHTTHTIDKKLAIRKPWEWKPSPYRWIDKPYIRESDKPYIERIINRGEIIDEFNYDSFARTKPLKVQNYPEGAGYKDRHGNLR